jgi:hypothetical protein
MRTSLSPASKSTPRSRQLFLSTNFVSSMERLRYAEFKGHGQQIGAFNGSRNLYRDLRIFGFPPFREYSRI